MRLRLDGVDRCGRAVDCRDTALDPARVLAAVRDPHDDRVRCPRAAPVHDHVGFVAVDATLNRRAAAAAVARSRGLRAPEADALAAAREKLTAIEATTTDLRPAREQAAATAGERERLRERVARLRGEVQARREAGLDAEETAERFRAAARELSEAATAEAAATERLDRERAQVRDRYDARERRLALEDEIGNLERSVRASLADAVRSRIEQALDALGADSDDPPAHLWTLAAARVAVVAAPVVVTAGPFDASEAAQWLDVPVVRL